MKDEWKMLPADNWGAWHEGLAEVKCPCGETLIVDCQNGVEECDCGRRYLASFNIKISELPV